MKIIILISSLGMGGAERVATSFANWLANNNVETYLISVSSKKTEYIVDKKVNIMYLGAQANSNSKNRHIRYRKIKESLNEIKADVVFCLTPALIKYCVFNKKNIVIGSERNNPYIQSKTFLAKLEKRFLSTFCDGYIFQTEGAKKYYPKKTQKKGIVIPNAVNNPLIKDLPTVTERKKNFVAVGRLEKQKDFLTLIKAFKLFSDKINGYTLTIYGEGKERNNLQKYIDEIHMKDKVYLPGKSYEAIKEINKASIYILSSIHEGMPNALIEALACGLPCIATKCDFGPEELIKNNKNGVLVNVGNYKEIACQMEKIILDKEFAFNLGKEAKKINITNSLDNIYNKHLHYLKSKMR